jgi:hypothetical protein
MNISFKDFATQFAEFQLADWEMSVNTFGRA